MGVLLLIVNLLSSSYLSRKTNLHDESHTQVIYAGLHLESNIPTCWGNKLWRTKVRFKWHPRGTKWRLRGSDRNMELFRRCNGSATDGPTFTVSGSEVSITFSTGETTTGIV